MKIRTRFAPSPTGLLHIGGLRTALYNFIFSYQNRGDFILRIEDTDQNRIVENATQKLIDSLSKFKLQFNEGPNCNEQYGPYIQSKRLSVYKKYYIDLLKQKKAYVCFVDGEDLIPEKNFDIAKLKMSDNNFVIKLVIPKEKELIAYDEIRGKIKFDLTLIDDPIIIKSDGYPTYHFANVIDDYSMKISHVIRGEEWLPSLPKHIILYDYLNWKQPKFIHLPLLLNPDKSKLSKRQGDVHVEDFLKNGYIVDAILNYVALLGWHPSSNDEIFSLEQLYKKFSIKRVQKSGAIFDIKKLNWINNYYIKHLSIQDFNQYATNYLKKSNIEINKIIDFNLFCNYFQNKINNFKELNEHYKMFIKVPKISSELKQLVDLPSSKKVIEYWITKLPNFKLDTIQSLVNNTTEELGIKGKDLFFPLRALLIGQTHGPDLPTIITILGLEETLSRLTNEKIR